MVLTPEWVSDGTDLVLMTTSAQKAKGKEIEKGALVELISIYRADFQRSQMVIYSSALF
jgi:hypothetical protein